MKDDPEGSKDKEKTERVIDVQPETDKEKV